MSVMLFVTYNLEAGVISALTSLAVGADFGGVCGEKLHAVPQENKMPYKLTIATYT